MAKAAFPDGIHEAHLRRGSLFPRPLRWLMLWTIGAVLLAALLGVFGGSGHATTTAEGPEARLRVEAPTIVRNGEVFEMRFDLEARQAIARPVIAVAEPYWRDITLNTMTPTPVSESFADGRFLFEFGPLQAGKALTFKVDAQVNPARFGSTRGAAEVRDGERTLASAPITLKVLP